VKRKKETNALEILLTYKGLVWPFVETSLKKPLFPSAFDVPSRYFSEHRFFWKVVKDYPKRQGKYLRPALLLLTARAMGVKINKPLLTVASAMQISEDFILVHDDIQDNSIQRRGSPALHLVYGVNNAINAGDALQALMWQEIAKVNNKKIQSEFFRIILRTMIGQTTEEKWKTKAIEAQSEKDWYFITDSKSAYYTIAGPMRLGAIMAGAKKNELEKISLFGLYMGRCFQLIDDILDARGNFKGLKKKNGNDIREGKFTIILGHLVKAASETDRELILKIVKKSKKTDKEVKIILALMEKYKSLEYARKIAQEYKEKALAYFEEELKFLSKEPFRKRLKILTQFILEREY